MQYRQVDLTGEGRLDYEAIEAFLQSNRVAMVYMQRSRGYEVRPSLHLEEIERVARLANVAPGPRLW